MSTTRRVLFFLAAITLILVARLINLFSFPMYLDEGIYISWIKLMADSSDYAYVSLNDGKTPLFIWLVAAVSDWFPTTWQAARTVSVLAGVVTAATWAIITRLLFGEKNQYLFLLLVLITPFLYFIERLAFVDSTLTMFLSLSFLCLVLTGKYIDNRQSSVQLAALLYSALSGLTIALAYMTKTSARVYLAAQLIICAVWIGEFVWRKQLKKALLVFLSGLIIFAVYHELVGYMRVGAARFWSGIAEKEIELTYSPVEILDKLRHDPGTYLQSVETAFWQESVYGLGGFILFLIGVISIFFARIWLPFKTKGSNLTGFKKKQIKTTVRINKWAIWLLMYIVITLGGSVLAGRVIASRYLYPVVPAMLSIATLGMVWFQNQQQVWLKLGYRLGLLITALGALVMIIAPLYYPYPGGENQIAQGDITALGLQQLPSALEDLSDSVILVTGIWGVRDGSVIYLHEKGIEAFGINEFATEQKRIEGSCPEGSTELEGRCWMFDLNGLDQSQKKYKYIYLTDRGSRPDLVLQLSGIQVEKEFKRPFGPSTYLLRYFP